ncbi:hypothetical protein PCE1_004739 [Barthelona sp. PCE]
MSYDFELENNTRATSYVLYESINCSHGNTNFTLSGETDWKLIMERKKTSAVHIIDEEFAIVLSEPENKHFMACGNKYGIITVVRQADTAVLVFKYDKIGISVINLHFLPNVCSAFSIYDKAFSFIFETNKNELYTYLILSDGSITDGKIKQLPFEIDSYILCARNWLIASITADGSNIGIFNHCSDSQAVLPYSIDEFDPTIDINTNHVTLSAYESGEVALISISFVTENSYSVINNSKSSEESSEEDSDIDDKQKVGQSKRIWSYLHFVIVLLSIYDSLNRLFFGDGFFFSLISAAIEIAIGFFCFSKKLALIIIVLIYRIISIFVQLSIVAMYSPSYQLYVSIVVSIYILLTSVMMFVEEKIKKKAKKKNEKKTINDYVTLYIIFAGISLVIMLYYSSIIDKQLNILIRYRRSTTEWSTKGNLLTMCMIVYIITSIILLIKYNNIKAWNVAIWVQSVVNMFILKFFSYDILYNRTTERTILPFIYAIGFVITSVTTAVMVKAHNTVLNKE